MTTEYTESDVLKDLESKVKASGIRRTARTMGISAAYLSDILLRRRLISPKIASAIGYRRERVVTFKFYKKDQP